MTAGRLGRLRAVIVDAVLLGMAAIEAFEAIGFSRSHLLAEVMAVVALCALPFRRRAPYLVFVATVPMLSLTMASIASLVALYTVAERRRPAYRSQRAR